MASDTPAQNLEDIVALAKRRGFLFQGSEIYGGLAGTFDYGPMGVELKRNIENAWWHRFVHERDDMYGLDASILMNPRVFKASGHLEGFSDPMVSCEKCGARFRADHLEENVCPECGGTLSDEQQFNMMFETTVGAAGGEEGRTYLRPETAQGIFVNFKNVLDSMHPELPFGIAQIGKAFRNEIAPRDFLFRTREFEQMEIEYFVHPDTWQEWFDTWANELERWLSDIGINSDHVFRHEVPEDERAHYSDRTIDFEFSYPFGVKELIGLAYRTDYDLRRHGEESGEDLRYTDRHSGEKFLPHVIEPSLGTERIVLALLCSAYREDEQDGEKRTYLALPPEIAPIKVAVFPLLKNKPELVEKARTVYMQLKEHMTGVAWDDNGNIGKRYRRQDEIGTPYCVTIDFDTLADDTVTVRNRDTLEQHRVSLSELVASVKTN